MKANTTRITIAMTAAALVATLASPMVAAAAPGKGGGGLGQGASTRLSAPQRAAGTSSTVKAQVLDNLKKRIANVLAARKARFDAAVSNLNMRIDRVTAIADKVEKAGGDVSSARASLAAAEGHLAKAGTLEEDAIASFESILSASNRGVAFKAARAKARLAHEEIKLARADIRTAAQGLREVVAELKARATTTP